MQTSKVVPRIRLTSSPSRSTSLWGSQAWGVEIGAFLAGKIIYIWWIFQQTMFDYWRIYV
jgi:hypothetical protein